MRNRDSSYFHTHVHSNKSCLDALPDIGALVTKAARLGQPAMGLTDHGNMSGSAQLYIAGKKNGVMTFPGLEGYLVEDTAFKAAQRYHVGLLARNLEGYRALIELTSASHTEKKFQRYPRFDFEDLAWLSENNADDVIVLSGCFFGLVQQNLVMKGQRESRAILEMYAQWFPHLFVEIQNHDIDHGNGVHDADICEELVEMADKIGLPVIATQDSHYLEKQEKEAHGVMKRMVFYREGAEPSDNEFPGDSFHFSTTGWVKNRHTEDNWERTLDSCEAIANMYELEIPPLDNFKAHIPSTVKNPIRKIKKLVYDQIDFLESENRLSKSFEKYEERVEHELSIISDLHMGGYFMLWVEFVEWCAKRKIAIEARGSANGSLVCYALGITSTDPLQWDLLFERFLSRDRKKPPDIDMDIEHARRGEAVAWLTKRFGAMPICTYSQLGSRDEDDKGSVLVSYNSYVRKQLGPEQFAMTLGKGFDTIESTRRYSPKDYKGLRLLSQHAANRSYGVHAAGLLLSGDDQKISDYIPTLWVASSKTRATQMTMDDVEEFGFIKLDILGQKTLTTMRRCQELMGRENPRDFSWIPFEDKETLQEIRRGNTVGIFQFEGYTATKGARELGVKSVYDCILANALYRTACIDSGVKDQYIARRKFPERRRTIRYPHPIFEKVLKSTYGCVLFQEQVLEIMRGLGLDYEGINTFFKIVKDSGKGATARNIGRADEVKKTWNALCEKNGIKDPDEAWHYIEGYTSYGFNKNHATGYGIRSYRVAYLKVHHTLEYMSALLESWAGDPKETKYVQETRRKDIRVLSPDVNVSGASWSIDRARGAIRRGLVSIKGVGKAVAEAIETNAPYESVEDMVDLIPARVLTGGKSAIKKGVVTPSELNGVLGKLRDAGALTSVGIRG